MTESKTKVSIRKKTSVEKSSLPSIESLVKDSWELFKKTILVYGKVLAAYFVVNMISSVILAILLIPLFITTLGPHGNNLLHPTTFQLIFLILSVLWGIISFVIFIISALFLPIAGTLILAKPQDKSLKESFKQTKPYIIVYFLTNLLASFFILGGVFLLVIPGLLIGFFFIFALFEVVLEKQKGIAALKQSYILVKNNFWQLLGRYLLLQIAIILLSIMLNKILGSSGILALLSMLLSVAAGWFGQVYMYHLYKQVKAKTKTNESPSLVWMWVLATVGWVVLVLSGVALTNIVMHYLQSPENPLNKIPQGTV